MALKTTRKESGRSAALEWMRCLICKNTRTSSIVTLSLTCRTTTQPQRFKNQAFHRLRKRIAMAHIGGKGNIFSEEKVKKSLVNNRIMMQDAFPSLVLQCETTQRGRMLYRITANHVVSRAREWYYWRPEMRDWIKYYHPLILPSAVVSFLIPSRATNPKP